MEGVRAKGYVAGAGGAKSPISWSTGLTMRCTHRWGPVTPCLRRALQTMGPMVRLGTWWLSHHVEMNDIGPGGQHCVDLSQAAKWRGWRAMSEVWHDRLRVFEGRAILAGFHDNCAGAASRAAQALGADIFPLARV